jgi:hypothetical protein
MVIPFRASLRSANFPDRFLRHQNLLGELTPISSEADATFIIANALNGDPSGGSGVSLASVNFPGFWLRYQNGRLKLEKEPVPDVGPAPETPELKQFREDVSFLMKNPQPNPESVVFFTFQQFFIPRLNREVALSLDTEIFICLSSLSCRNSVSNAAWDIAKPFVPRPPTEPH